MKEKNEESEEKQTRDDLKINNHAPDTKKKSRRKREGKAWLIYKLVSYLKLRTHKTCFEDIRNKSN